MARVSNPLIGKSKNKIGSVVFTTWKGINVLKEKPQSVANPQTDNQLMRRSAFTQIVAISRIIYAAIFLGFKEQAVQKSEVNAFNGYNLNNAFDYSAPPAATIQPANILVSQGTISTTAITSVVADDSANSVTIINSPAATQPGQSANDQMCVVLYNQTTDQWEAFVTSDDRANGGTEVNPTIAMVAGQTMRVYTFFRNITSGKSSDSVTTTTVVVA